MSYPTPPAQNPACGIPAPGSHLRWVTAKLAVHAPARGTRWSGAGSGACRSGSCSPRPWSLAPRPPPTVARPRSRGSSLLRQGPTSRGRTSSATAQCLPDADHTAPAGGQPRDLPVPAQGACAHARVSDRAGSSGGSRWRRPPCCLPLSRRRRHPEADFRGSMAGLCVPLSTLRRTPRGAPRMTRGRCGSLLLHRVGLSPTTPCRSPGAPRRGRKRPLLRMRPSFANTDLTLRKPPPGPRFARPEDKLRGCLEGCSHGNASFSAP
jgi:hypothetical protein